MSLRRIDRIVDAMRDERYRFSPVRRVYIPKKSGALRPLGLPTWSDKLVGEVVRLLLEAYYEPTFSDRSHGFRPGRGCHTALREVANTWTGTTWFIEGDLADCFGSFDHSVLLQILGERIHDNRFLRLVRQMCQAGYLEDWTWGATLSGVPQGGVASPVLSNVYLDKLDIFVEKVLIPEYTRGKLRARNLEYREVERAISKARRREDRALMRSLYKRLHSLPSQDPDDPGYRRLRYCRYADDTLLGFAGPKIEAEAIKQRLAVFLRDELKLELSPAKTLITHARTQRARFLGYEINVAGSDRRTRRPNQTDRRNRRSLNGTIVLHVPASVIKAKSSPYMARGVPACRNRMVNEADYSIVGRYGAEYRGLVQYYLLASDVFRLHRLRWVMETSMLTTLSRKHRASVSKIAARYKAKIETPHGLRTCFEASVERNGKKPLVARFGGIPLKRHKTAVLTDRLATGPVYPNKELIRRLLAGRCELCGRTDGIQVHHIRNLAELDTLGTLPPDWAQVMAKRRRKSLVVCDVCHGSIHKERVSITE
ncbi:MAG TPA: reverse transcriptase domain-containing protein, partial [Acidimicrobiales bacterium]|nr:reverse transcriptase domain-containing protein [Acidimicrobiales bacterium]